MENCSAEGFYRIVFIKAPEGSIDKKLIRDFAERVMTDPLSYLIYPFVLEISKRHFDDKEDVWQVQIQSTGASGDIELNEKQPLESITGKQGFIDRHSISWLCPTVGYVEITAITERDIYAPLSTPIAKAIVRSSFMHYYECSYEHNVVTQNEFIGIPKYSKRIPHIVHEDKKE